MPVRYHTIAKKDAGQRLDRWLQTYYPGLPYSQMQRAMRTGEIRLDSGRVKGHTRIEAGQQLRLPPQFTGHEAVAIEPDLSVDEIELIRSLEIYRNDHYIAINKPAGIASQGGTDIDQHIDRLSYGLRDSQSEDPPRLVHRLDKQTSGILILARTRKAATRMMKQFKRRDVSKLYIAVTEGVPPEGSKSSETGDLSRIDQPLIKRPTPVGDRVVVDHDKGQRAVTDFKVIDQTDAETALVALWPKTGRQHQLRAHMDHLDCPLRGATKYMVMPGGFACTPIRSVCRLRVCRC